MTASRKKRSLATRERSKHSPTGDYDVGYARPPAASQFQKGQSGNPKGRPRRSRNKLTMFKESIKRTLEKRVSVRVAGEFREMPMAEALGVSAVTRAATNGKELQYLLRLLDALGITQEENQISELADMEHGEAAMLEVVELLLKRGRVVVNPATNAVNWASPEMAPSYQARMDQEKASKRRQMPK